MDIVSLYGTRVPLEHVACMPDHAWLLALTLVSMYGVELRHMHTQRIDGRIVPSIGFVVLLATDHSVAQSPSSHYILALVLLVWFWLLPSPRGRGPLDLSVR